MGHQFGTATSTAAVIVPQSSMTCAFMPLSEAGDPKNQARSYNESLDAYVMAGHVFPRVPPDL